MLDHLASANPVSLCDPMACGKGRQSTRGHERDAVYNERRGQRGGLGWKGSGILHWWQRMRSNTANRTPALSLQWSTEAKSPKCLLNLTWRSSDVSHTGSIDIARD
uniref:Uncharacterized protein n=1 Tax=Mesocestoides corti TaxID=53468 RepID=A0A5K3G8E0_MESCO